MKGSIQGKLVWGTGQSRAQCLAEEWWLSVTLYFSVVVSKQNGDLGVYNKPLETASQKPEVKQQSLEQTVIKVMPAKRR